MSKAEAVRIVKRLREHGHEAYLVGGCVRDLLLGRRPKDYDVATSARPEEVMRLFRKTIPVGAHFGVVVVRRAGRNYEVATFRRDLGYSDGRHPDGVCFATAEEDARRRDFTINGLFYDPIGGQEIDYVGGRADLRAGIIRAIGNPTARFREDKLRMLRAIRFSARFGYVIEEKTGRAIKRHAAEVREVSAERIREELRRALLAPRPTAGIRLLDEYGLLRVILPEVWAMKGVEQPPEFHPEGDVYTHTLLMLDMMKRPFARFSEFVLGVLLHDVGKPPTFTRADRIRFNNHPLKGAEIAERILRRLRFSNDTIKTVTDLVGSHLKFMDLHHMRPATLKRFLRQENFELHLELHRLDCLASHGKLENYRLARKKLRELSREKHALRPPRLLSGHDLIALGLKPGPLFKKILSALEDAQLEGLVKTREDAYAWLKHHLPEIE